MLHCYLWSRGTVPGGTKRYMLVYASRWSNNKRYAIRGGQDSCVWQLQGGDCCKLPVLRYVIRSVPMPETRYIPGPVLNSELVSPGQIHILIKGHADRAVMYMTRYVRYLSRSGDAVGCLMWSSFGVQDPFGTCLLVES